ncbi:MAG: HAD-IIIC family phosphatase [Candidatus Schekmanbacteria bacterium]|nr:HAD-IIIC family phosphatase [Candidatus Schekmanbacteria bacterium]
MRTADILSYLAANRERIAAAPGFRVLVLRDVTVEPLAAPLRYCLAEHGLRAEVTFGGYGTAVQDAMRATGAKWDLVLVFFALEELAPDYDVTGLDAAEVAERLRQELESIAAACQATVLVPTFPPPLSGYPLRRDPGLADQIRAVNDRLREAVHGAPYPVRLLDLALVLGGLGWERALDPRSWYLHRLPFSGAALQLIAREAALLGAEQRGHLKKCIVLDCDDTLWGGIVGEVGPERIELHPREFPGSAFYDFQKRLVALSKQGILLCLCSKNDEEQVFAVLDRHPHCRLRREHLAAWRVNWRPKPENLRELAEELGLGLDSILFVDDQPRELEAARMLFPDICCVLTPQERHALPALLDRFFSIAEPQEEDLRRLVAVQADATRLRERARHGGSLDAYLASLATVASVHRMRREEVARACRLSQRTNQFNLTMRRYSEGELLNRCQDPSYAAFTLSVRDRFGDLGLVGVLVARRENATAEIEALFVSCRALGRNAEDAFTRACLDDLRKQWRPSRWRAAYMAAARNGQVERFWERFNFSAMRTDAGTKILEADQIRTAEALGRHVELTD